MKKKRSSQWKVVVIFTAVQSVPFIAMDRVASELVVWASAMFLKSRAKRPAAVSAAVSLVADEQ